MDAFFAAVEARDNPSLADRPFAVGGMSMISTANYVARRFGVRSAMPGFIAVKLCPELVFIQPNFDKYAAASAEARKVFAEYDPAFSSWSMDEASLDATEHCRRTGQSGAEVAQAIRDKVRAQTRLTCSVGVAPNRMLAKICSDTNKPDGQFVVPPVRRAVLDFVGGMSVRKVPGIG
ncbi:impB/mucB/samB UV-protection protein, partial [Helicosporidium sp. ATCC 50920]